jgi:hypothetical protein
MNKIKEKMDSQGTALRGDSDGEGNDNEINTKIF